MKHPAIRYHGGKFRLAPWILGFFPVHRCYVEPFGGAAGVLLQKPRAYAEVYNDLDGDMANFFRVLRDPARAQRLIELCHLTPYSRSEFELAFESSDDDVERARRTAIRASMGFGSAGATKGVTGMRMDTERAYGHAAHLWARYPDALAAVCARFQGVFVENRPAIEVMRQHDAPDTLHYCDPPYVMETRHQRASSGMYYRHEMTDEQHEELLLSLQRLQGSVAISGYSSPLYDGLLAGWERHETSSRISAGRGGDVRTEVVWMNETCSTALRRPRSQADLIAEV